MLIQSTLLLVVAATGQAGSVAEPSTAAVLACRAIGPAQERLSCFDREAARMAEAIASDRVRMVEPGRLRAQREAQFGLPADTTGPDARLSHAESVVASAAVNAEGRAVLALANGSRWRQIDDYPLPHAPRAGDAVVIDLTSLGSYKMRVGRNAAIRVRRVDRP